jgi:glucosamine 6-phosphate synthetase-like amidotransferase/phosphosugar isomerase protein
MKNSKIIYHVMSTEDREYLQNLEEEIINDLSQKIKVVGEMIKDENQHGNLAIILNTETVLTDSVFKMGQDFSKESVTNIKEALKVYNDERYYFIRAGTEMGSDAGMKYLFEEYKELVSYH